MAQHRAERAALDSKEETAKKAIEDREAAIAQNVFRPENTNLLAYTHTGGRRTDDPEPVRLSDASRGRGVTTVRITNLWGEGWVRYVQIRLVDIVRTEDMVGRVTQGSNDVKIDINDLSDAEALAKLIDFGTVTRADKIIREIDVKADPTRLPKPRKSISKVPDEGFAKTSILKEDPDFPTADLIRALTDWDWHGRVNACDRLARLRPDDKDEHARILKAVEIRLDDFNPYVSKAAARAINMLKSYKY